MFMSLASVAFGPKRRAFGHPDTSKGICQDGPFCASKPVATVADCTLVSGRHYASSCSKSNGVNYHHAEKDLDTSGPFCPSDISGTTAIRGRDLGLGRLAVECQAVPLLYLGIHIWMLDELGSIASSTRWGPEPCTRSITGRTANGDTRLHQCSAYGVTKKAYEITQCAG